MLDEAREKDPHAKLFDEADGERHGVRIYPAGDSQAALAVMKLNVKAYPNSPNTYDSLADAYLATGQQVLARQASEDKALVLILPSIPRTRNSYATPSRPAPKAD